VWQSSCPARPAQVWEANFGNADVVANDMTFVDLPHVGTEVRYDGNVFDPAVSAPRAEPVSAWEALVQSQNDSLAFLFGWLERCVAPLQEAVQATLGKQETHFAEVSRLLAGLHGLIEGTEASLRSEMNDKIKGCAALFIREVSASHRLAVSPLIDFVEAFGGKVLERLDALEEKVSERLERPQGVECVMKPEGDSCVVVPSVAACCSTRRLSCSDFFQVAQLVKARRPHLREPTRAPLMICDGDVADQSLARAPCRDDMGYDALVDAALAGGIKEGDDTWLDAVTRDFLGSWDDDSFLALRGHTLGAPAPSLLVGLEGGSVVTSRASSRCSSPESPCGTRGAACSAEDGIVWE